LSQVAIANLNGRLFGGRGRGRGRKEESKRGKKEEKRAYLATHTLVD